LNYFEDAFDGANNLSRTRQFNVICWFDQLNEYSHSGVPFSQYQSTQRYTLRKAGRIFY